LLGIDGLGDKASKIALQGYFCCWDGKVDMGSCVGVGS